MAKILVIDDEEDFNNILCAKLQRVGGHETMSAYDGAQGLELAKSFAPDLIILDVMMPEMDGFEVFQKLQEDEKTRSIPVVVFSALSNPRTIKNFKDAGAKEYIVKATNFSDMVPGITAAIEKHVKK